MIRNVIKLQEEKGPMNLEKMELLMLVVLLFANFVPANNWKVKNEQFKVTAKELNINKMLKKMDLNRQH